MGLTMGTCAETGIEKRRETENRFSNSHWQKKLQGIKIQITNYLLDAKL